jgi:hypothetical protein
MGCRGTEHGDSLLGWAAGPADRAGLVTSLINSIQHRRATANRIDLSQSINRGSGSGVFAFNEIVCLTGRASIA